MKLNPGFTFALKLSVGVSAVWLLIATGRLSPQALAATDLSRVLLLVTPLLLLNLLSQALRWWSLLRAHRLDVSIGHCLQIAWIGNLFSMVLPGAVGGELARVYYLWQRQPERRLAVMLSVLVDRGLGLFSLFLLAGAAFATWGAPTESLRALGVTSLALVAVASLGVTALMLPGSRRSITALLPPRWSELAQGEASAYRRGWGWVLLATALSIAAAISLMAAYWSAAVALGQPLGVMATVTAVPFVVAANSVPISPGGLGVGESVASGILAVNGYGQGAELALLVRLILTLLRAIGLAPYLLHRG